MNENKVEIGQLPDIQRRLRSIEGHVRGVARMIEQGETCPSILLQLSAIQGALTKVRHIIVRDYFESCLTDGRVDDLSEELAKTLNELSEILLEATY